ncbi:hypothetical protein EZS27_022196 [termite gut metagenome]|uniref:Uncharacterized protein n=1 Tax=termite gut metagenome TaxID=433724 RepID=A0A5J4R473_9ZZZZ
MEIGLIHITDIHISLGNVWLDDKMQKIASAVKNNFENSIKCISS